MKKKIVHSSKPYERNLRSSPHSCAMPIQKLDFLHLLVWCTCKHLGVFYYIFLLYFLPKKNFSAIRNPEVCIYLPSLPINRWIKRVTSNIQCIPLENLHMGANTVLVDTASHIAGKKTLNIIRNWIKDAKIQLLLFRENVCQLEREKQKVLE